MKIFLSSMEPKENRTIKSSAKRTESKIKFDWTEKIEVIWFCVNRWWNFGMAYTEYGVTGYWLLSWYHYMHKHSNDWAPCLFCLIIIIFNAIKQVIETANSSVYSTMWIQTKMKMNKKKDFWIFRKFNQNTSIFRA